MLFHFFLIALAIYEVIRKKDKIYAILIITPLVILTLNHTNLFTYLDQWSKIMIIILSVVLSLLIIIFYYMVLIDKLKK